MTQSTATIFFYWFVAAAPGLPFVLIYFAYRRTLFAKRLTVQQVMTRRGVLESYLDAFGRSRGDAQLASPEQVVRELFNLYYHWRSYAFGLFLNLAVITLAVGCTLAPTGVALGFPKELQTLSVKTPLTLSAAFAGAYIWNLYDLIRRYRAVDLTPAAFQFSWLRMLAACIVGPLAALGAADGIKTIVAFGFGILPLQTIFQYFTDYATKRLGMGAAVNAPAAGPSLHNLQSMTKDMIDRMEEENIDSTAVLAYSDPMKLFLKTDIEWVVIIDIIDQALLFNYVDQKLALLRPLGIRGSIEMAVVYKRLKIGSPEDKSGAAKMIATIATKLSQSGDEADNLVRTVWEDDQVNLISKLFGEAYANGGIETSGAESRASGTV